MKTHYLKTWPEYYTAIVLGVKKFEVRKNDRDFAVGDTLVLQEYKPESREFTGREVSKTVGYILHGPAFGIEDGFCVMSLLNK